MFRVEWFFNIDDFFEVTFRGGKCRRRIRRRFSSRPPIAQPCGGGHNNMTLLSSPSSSPSPSPSSTPSPSSSSSSSSSPSPSSQSSLSSAAHRGASAAAEAMHPSPAAAVAMLASVRGRRRCCVVVVAFVAPPFDARAQRRVFREFSFTPSARRRRVVRNFD